MPKDALVQPTKKSSSSWILPFARNDFSQGLMRSLISDMIDAANPRKPMQINARAKAHMIS